MSHLNEHDRRRLAELTPHSDPRAAKVQREALADQVVEHESLTDEEDRDYGTALDGLDGDNDDPEELAGARRKLAEHNRGLKAQHGD